MNTATIAIGSDAPASNGTAALTCNGWADTTSNYDVQTGLLQMLDSAHDWSAPPTCDSAAVRLYCLED